ncbi:hypothetical protein BSLG_004401 [Batrachochytrium salamandrivorans]|nr:hypothetical protein BSLG_004401 [Batrachochytrium salamandrivorans]
MQNDTTNAEEDEVFEIIDYTATSSLERLIATIESILVQWGVGQGSLGVLDPMRQTLSTSHKQQESCAITNKDQVDADLLLPHTRYKTVVFEERPYTLSYHSLPAPLNAGVTDTAEALKQHLHHQLRHQLQQQNRCMFPPAIAEYSQGIHAMAEFLTYKGSSQSNTSHYDTSQFASAALNLAYGTDNHRSEAVANSHILLHRWTGLTHLIVFSGIHAPLGSNASPALNYTRQEDDSDDVQIDPSTASSMVDINTCKRLSSAFQIALSNIRCTLPVFIQTGQIWKRLYHGVLVSTGTVGSCLPAFEALGRREAVQRYRMSFLPYIPPAHASLDALCRIFKDRFDLANSDIPLTEINKYIFASVATRYVYDVDPLDRSDMKHLPQELQQYAQYTPQLIDIPDLVTRVTLETCYPISPVDSYIGLSIDPALSTHWHISMTPTRAPRHMYLSKMLATVLCGWSEAVPTNPPIQAIASDQMQLPGSFYSASGFSHSRSLDSPRQRLVDYHDVIDTVRAMLTTCDIVPRFQRGEGGDGSAVSTESKSDATFSSTFGTPLIARKPRSTNQTILLMQYQSATLPMQSPLWVLATRLLDACMACPRLLRFDAGLLALLTGVWGEFVGELTQLWDLGHYIPGVDVRVLNDNGSEMGGGHVDIDTRYTLIHQKLAMLNCCIYRKTCVYPSPSVVSQRTKGGSVKDPSVSAKETPISHRSAHSLGDPLHGSNTGSNTAAKSSISTRLLGTLTDIASAAMNDSVDTLSKAISSPTRRGVFSTLTSTDALKRHLQTTPRVAQSDGLNGAHTQDTVSLIHKMDDILQSSHDRHGRPNEVLQGLTPVPKLGGARNEVMMSESSHGDSLSNKGGFASSIAAPLRYSGSGSVRMASDCSVSRGDEAATRLSVSGVDSQWHDSEHTAMRDLSHRAGVGEGSLCIGSRTPSYQGGHGLQMEMHSALMGRSAGDMEGTSWNSDKSWGRCSVHDNGSVSHQREGRAGKTKHSPFLEPYSSDESTAEPDLMFEPMEGWDDGKNSNSLQRLHRSSGVLLDDCLTAMVLDNFSNPVHPPPGGYELTGSFVEVYDPRSLSNHRSDVNTPPVVVGSAQYTPTTSSTDAAANTENTSPERSDLDSSSADGAVDGSVRTGQLAALEGMRLIATGEQMYEPHTQESGYMTEDMVREQEQILESLGTNAAAAKLRARMQCSQLVSDMEAFKAANPGALLEDFVRWHSPRDWIEEAGQVGRLSGRMTDPGNLWRECWEGAKSIPASKQKPLFDFEKEAAKALHYLESRLPHQILSELMPTLFLVVYDVLVKHPVTLAVSSVSQAVEKLGQLIVSTRWGDIEPDMTGSVDAIIQEICQIEIIISQSISLLRKLPGQYGLVSRLVQDQHTAVMDEERDGIYRLFGSGEDGSFPFPYAREYILQTVRLPKRPTHSDALVHSIGRGVYVRLFALLMDNEFRLVESVQTPRMY